MRIGASCELQSHPTPASRGTPARGGEGNTGFGRSSFVDTYIYSIPTLKSRARNYAINDMEVAYRVWPTLVKCERAVTPVQALACAERKLTTVVGIGRYP